MSGNALRYGLYLPAFGPFGDPAVLVDLAVRAEASGWDGVFLGDHLVQEALPIAARRPLWRAMVSRDPAGRSFADIADWGAYTYVGGMIIPASAEDAAS